MQILIVHPGAQFSTSDVYDGLVAGLRAQGGVTLHEARLDTICAWYASLIADGVTNGILAADALQLDGRLNRSALVSAHVTRQALLLRPDWVVVVSGHNFNAHDARALSRAGIRTAVLLTESPYWRAVEMEIASYYDVAFTNDRATAWWVPWMHYLPHAYNPAVHTPDGPRADPCDAVFIGSMFDERKALLGGVDWTGIRYVQRGMLLPDGTNDIVSNYDVAAYYRSARVSINHHRTTRMHGSGEHIAADEAESLNPRAYEISACGGFQLMDDSRAERHDVFGDTCPTYRSGDAADLERQVRYWLTHHGRREETARQMTEAVRPHAWTARARRVLEVLA